MPAVSPGRVFSLSAKGRSSMPPPQRIDPELPDLSDLGRDLLTTTQAQRRLGLARPFLGLMAFVLAASVEWWWLTPPLAFFIFVAVVTVTHDVVHGSLGLSRQQTSALQQVAFDTLASEGGLTPAPFVLDKPATLARCVDRR